MKWEYMTIALKAGGFLGGKVNPDELTARLDEAGAAGYAVRQRDGVRNLCS
ncbi:MAG TPA: hypothetical protein VIQ74_05600 [Gemmatimonadaceae bacterium]